MKTSSLILCCTLLLVAGHATAKYSASGSRAISAVHTTLGDPRAAAPWRAPSGAHPFGTILVASFVKLSKSTTKSGEWLGHVPTLYEIDVATGKRIASVRLAKAVRGYGLGVAADDHGAVVIAGGADEDFQQVRVWVLNQNLRILRRLAPKRDARGVSARIEKDVAVVSYRFATTINGVFASRQAVTTLRVPSGNVIGRTVFPEGPAAPHSDPPCQALVHAGRVYTLVRSKNVDVFAHSLDFRRLYARYHRKMPDTFVMSGHASLTQSAQDILVSLDPALVRLSSDLAGARELSPWPVEKLKHDHELAATGVVHPTTGELLLDTGYLAPSFKKAPRRFVTFSRAAYCAREPCEASPRPSFEDEPIGSFWLLARAVIVTRGKKLGIVSVDPAAAPRL